jgi:hypothetical protein
VNVVGESRSRAACNAERTTTGKLREGGTIKNLEEDGTTEQEAVFKFREELEVALRI